VQGADESKKSSRALLLIVAAVALNRALNRIINSAMTYGNVERRMRQPLGKALPVVVTRLMDD